jgi:hypothetical protein
VEFVAVNVAGTTGPDWLRRDPALRGHWHALISFCAMRENGGTVVGAAAWTNRDWDRTAGVTRAALRKLADGDEPLVRWDGDDLVVLGYDRGREAAAVAGRERGRYAAEVRWHGKPKSEATPPESLDSVDATASAPADATGGTSASTAGTTDQSRSDQSREEPVRDSVPTGPEIPELAWRCADYLRKYVLRSNPTNKLSKVDPWEGSRNRKDWADTFRLMAERDPDDRTYDAIKDSVCWLFTQPNNFVVWSAGSLRKKWDNVRHAMNRPVDRKPDSGAGGPRLKAIQ